MKFESDLDNENRLRLSVEKVFEPIDTSGFGAQERPRQIEIQPILSLLGFILDQKRKGNYGRVIDIVQAKKEYAAYRTQEEQRIHDQLNNNL